MGLSQLGEAWTDRVVRASSALAAQTGLGPPKFERLELLAPLLDRVAQWTARVDLTAARSADELVDLYLADAWLLSGAGGPGRWVDVGAGGGAPGLVMALLNPDLQITLVEPRAKRVAFLRTTASALGAASVRIERARSEGLAASAFDVAVSRATLPPDLWLREGARLASGEVWVLLAGGPVPDAPGLAVALDISYTWPLTGVSRRAVCYRRSGRMASTRT